MKTPKLAPLFLQMTVVTAVLAASPNAFCQARSVEIERRSGPTEIRRMDVEAKQSKIDTAPILARIDVNQSDVDSFTGQLAIRDATQVEEFDQLMNKVSVYAAGDADHGIRATMAEGYIKLRLANPSTSMTLSFAKVIELMDSQSPHWIGVLTNFFSQANELMKADSSLSQNQALERVMGTKKYKEFINACAV